MDRADQRKITSNLGTIKSAIKKDVDRLTERLIEERIFSKYAKDEIANTETDIKCGVFINRLLRGGSRAYPCFKDILEELGHHKLVVSLERSKTICTGVGWIDEREKTFIVPPPKIPSLVNTKIEEEKDENERTEKEVVQLERMVTFVLNTMKEKNTTGPNNTKDFKKEFRKKLMEESKDNDELMNFFKTLRCSSIN